MNNSEPLSVTKEQIEAIVNASVFIYEKMGLQTTVAHATLPNGFEIVESSGCLNPAKYKHEIGVAICRERIISRLWQLEGYVLQYANAIRGADGT